jgi:hypothetical protein
MNMNTLGKDNRTHGKRANVHTHCFVQHPDWTTHVTCKVCRMSMSKEMLPMAIAQGATSEV